jgi:hypothetical protein
MPFLLTILMGCSLWSLQTHSIMGAEEGPPPCESQACFTEAVSACRANVSYFTNTAAGGRAQYMIEGSTAGGSCQLGMIYMQHPQSDWTYKPLHFLVDPDGDIETLLKETVSDCL